MSHSRCILGVLGTLSVLMVGCGTARRTPKDGQEFKVTHVNAVDYGHRVNIRASDVQKFVRLRYPRARQTISGPFGSAVEGCDGVEPHAGEVVGVTSQTFHDVKREQAEGGGFSIYSVQSAVYVMNSSELARREITAAIGPRGRECLKQAVLSANPVTQTGGARIRELLGSHGVKGDGTRSSEHMLSKIEISTAPWYVLGASVYRLRTASHTVTVVTGTNGASNYYDDQFAFSVGRAVVLLKTVGSPRPFSRQEEHRLLSVLYTRAKKSS